MKTEGEAIDRHADMKTEGEVIDRHEDRRRGHRQT